MSTEPRRTLNEQTIREALEADSSRPTPEPPADLAERIKNETPARLELAPELAPDGTGHTGRGRWLAAAAAVLVAVGAGVVGVRVLDRTGDPMMLRDEGAGVAGTEAPAAPTSEAAPAAEPGRTAVRGAAKPSEEAELAPPGSARPTGESDAAEPPSRQGRKDDRESASTARDPWTVVTQTPGVLSDRINVGGEESGQQAVFSESAETKSEDSFEVDGVVITDMAAIGSSPSYYDFDQLEEMRIEPGPAPETRDAAYSTPEAPEPARRPAPEASPSTGGTAEPNDQPYGDVFFRGYGTNPFVDPEDDPLSTFGLDVDTGSWGVVQRFLGDGNLPPREAVRVEELVNAFDYGDPAPDEGDFRIVAEGSGTPFADRRDNPRYRLLRFGLRAREVDASERRPAVLTFVVDVSGSMGREDRLGLVRRALALLLDQLRPDDRVALVIYGSRGRVVLDHTGDLEAIRSAVGRLRPEGSTNAEEGLVLAYEAARRAYREGAINRVILCSDGVANVGRTGPESILERIGDEARGGIELTTVGFGMGNYNDVLMEQLADRGDGAYAYVDDLDEARRIFVENLTGTLQTVARDSKVQVEYDPEVVSRYRLLGYENREVPDERFRDDTVDAGEVGAGHAVTALYELKLREGIDPRDPEDAARTAATLRLRWRSTETGRVEEMARRVTVAELAGAWEEAPASLRLASVVAELAEALKGTYWARGSDLDELFRRAQRVSADFPGDLRVAELVTIIGRAARIPTD